MKKALILIIILPQLCVSQDLVQLFRNVLNYRTDYTIDEILKTMIRGSQLTVDSLFVSDGSEIPVEADVTFWCRHPDLDEKVQVFVNDDDLEDKLNVKLPVAFVIHGWIDNANRTWVTNIMNDYLEFVDTNVCGVDWSRLSLFEYSTAADRNVPIVAEHLTSFIEFLSINGVSLDDITIVGHSLGAHIAGLTGSMLNGELDQIIGLDPAGPLFTAPLITSTTKRLDESDAKFVQVIYTTRHIFGCSISVGHQNFFPNGGVIPQPGCLFPVATGGLSPEMVTCSHAHAAAYFRFSLNPENIFIGRQCSSGLAFTTGTCFSRTFDRMGIYSKRRKGDFYLTTYTTEPYV